MTTTLQAEPSRLANFEVAERCYYNLASLLDDFANFQKGGGLHLLQRNPLWTRNFAQLQFALGESAGSSSDLTPNPNLDDLEDRLSAALMAVERLTTEVGNLTELCRAVDGRLGERTEALSLDIRRMDLRLESVSKGLGSPLNSVADNPSLDHLGSCAKESELIKLWDVSSDGDGVQITPVPGGKAVLAESHQTTVMPPPPAPLTSTSASAPQQQLLPPQRPPATYFYVHLLPRRSFPAISNEQKIIRNALSRHFQLPKSTPELESKPHELPICHFLNAQGEAVNDFTVQCENNEVARKAKDVVPDAIRRSGVLAGLNTGVDAIVRWPGPGSPKFAIEFTQSHGVSGPVVVGATPGPGHGQNARRPKGQKLLAISAKHLLERCPGLGEGFYQIPGQKEVTKFYFRVGLGFYVYVVSEAFAQAFVKQNPVVVLRCASFDTSVLVLEDAEGWDESVRFGQTDPGIEDLLA